MTPAAAKAHSRFREASRSLGIMVRDRRVKLGLSVNELARQSGMSWSSWDRLEKGHPTLLSMFKAAEVLGWELFVDVEDE